MTVVRLQCAWQMDTAFPRDAIMINPVFNVQDVGPDFDALCEDLATALKDWDVNTTQLTVKAYDIEATPPNEPLGSAIRNTNSFETGGVPREVALCFSYYATENRPRRRGRLYIPACVFTGAAGGVPTSTHMTKVAGLAPIFADLGGADVDFSCYSRSDGDPHAITHWWVDNEWDTIRSRGLRSTTRQSGTMTEEGFG